VLPSPNFEVVSVEYITHLIKLVIYAVHVKKAMDAISISDFCLKSPSTAKYAVKESIFENDFYIRHNSVSLISQNSIFKHMEVCNPSFLLLYSN
jgi:hypothetical protein